MGSKGELAKSVLPSVYSCHKLTQLVIQSGTIISYPSLLKQKKGKAMLAPLLAGVVKSFLCRNNSNLTG